MFLTVAMRNIVPGLSMAEFRWLEGNKREWLRPIAECVASLVRDE